MENLHSYRCTAEQNRLYLPYYHDLCSLWRKGTVPPMKGRMKPYLPELTIRDYNIYLQYLRGVRRQLYTEFGWYSCHLLRYNGVVFAILSDSLAGRTATCRKGTTLKLFSRSVSASESCASVWGDSCTRISYSGP